MNSTITTIARYLLGIAMLVFGANKFLHFMPQPELSEAAGTFMGALDGSGYIFPILGIIYIIAGLCLVLNKAVPFALIMLVPVSINIMAFHLTFDVANIAGAAVVTILNILLIYAYWDRFKTLFK
ncbi:DoxX protein [Polaribacter sp. MSW13]|uniref:DoxX protein n=1 Tax=Polaribacter marinus TaxID=2916838 RepID=A0A9X1VMX8_9FLAO|nr:DoxX protein [Polaribacter marinus]MCI2229489.1 DoxX protein [Polaribacter marinus]